MTPAELRNYRALLILIVLVPLLALSVERCSALPVEYNPERSPLPVAPMELAIEYAAEFAWSQYVAVGAEYEGETGEELADGKIIVRWSYFPLPETGALSVDTGLVEYSADLGSSSTTLANARWWLDEAGLARAVITLNIALASPTVDRCMLETLVHEFGHVFMPVSAHSDYPGDVMFPTRGACRHSPSLTDLAMIRKPMLSCHVELTPDGWLEYPDYNGKRIALQPLALSGSLTPPAFGKWLWGSIDENPVPRACNSVIVGAGAIWAEVKGFGREPAVLRLIEPVPGLFVNVPLTWRAP